MDWYVAVILCIICAVLFFFFCCLVGVNVYEKEHMISSQGGLYMHEDDDIVQETKDNKDEVPKKYKAYVPSEPVDAMQMLLDGWCDDCEEDVSECMKSTYCKASYKGDNKDE